MRIPETKAPPPPPGWKGPALSQMDRIEAGQARIEEKLDVLLEALAADGEQDEPPALTLEGALAGGARSEGEPL